MASFASHRVLESSIIDHFFDDEATLRQHFTENQYNRIIRLRTLYDYMLRNPLMPETKIKEWIRATFKINERQSQLDFREVQLITGHTRVDKGYYRKFTIESILHDLSKTEDVLIRTKLYAQLISVARLDKEDPEPIDLDAIYPIPVEPTGDVSVLGLTPAPEGLAEELRRRFGKEAREQAEDVQYEDTRTEDVIGDAGIKIQDTRFINSGENG
jgi:hypothetical protein